MTAFQELGLRDELLHVLDDFGYDRPTDLQRAMIPVLRRGGNMIARASTGAGKTLAYALGILDRLEPSSEEGEPTLRLLVLSPTRDEAERVALMLVPLAQSAGLTLSVLGGRWGTSPAEAEVLIATPAEVHDAVTRSALKLEGVEALVVDGAAAIRELGGWDAVDTLFDHLPRDSQRVVISARFSEDVEELVDRRVKRALRYPAESAVPEEAPKATGEIGYVLVPEREKVDVAARLLTRDRAGNAPPLLFFRTDERAAEITEALAMRGFVLGDLEDEDMDAAIASADASREELIEESGTTPDRTVSYDVPTDTDGLLARHHGDERALVLVEPRELPHFQEIARRAHLTAYAVPLPVDEGAVATEVERFRAELRRALEDQDLGAQMLVLEPLFEEFGAPEIAAAAAALLRQRRPVTTGPVAVAGAAATPSVQAKRETAAAGAPPKTWARLYVGVGKKDDVRPGDIVGAIAGEANVAGSAVGRIDIRDSFSVVEVQADLASQIIEAVNGTTVKGRSVRVDYDRGEQRKGGTPQRRRPAGDAPQRRIVRRKPREE